MRMKMKMKMFHSDKISDQFFPEFWGLSGAKECKSCRSRKILKNAPTLAIVAVDTAENEPLKIWGWFHSCFNELPSGYRWSAGPGSPRFAPVQTHTRLPQVPSTGPFFLPGLPRYQASEDCWAHAYVPRITTWAKFSTRLRKKRQAMLQSKNQHQNENLCWIIWVSNHTIHH